MRKKKRIGDPFKKLLSYYKREVRKIDGKHNDEKFKNAWEAALSELSERNWTVTDVESDDGYFIFPSGSDSVVSFHVAECTGWKFGVWWSLPESKKAHYVNGDFFAQYERCIDKFKPSNSNIGCSFSIVPERRCQVLWNVNDIMIFIRDEPELAFCRDHLYWNLNTQYHTREEAKREFDNFIEKEDRKDKLTKEYDEKILSFYRDAVFPECTISDIHIKDLGDGWNPRFQIEAPYESNKNTADAPGLYDIFDFIPEETSYILREQLVMICKECDPEDFFWFSPIGRDINLYEEKKEEEKNRVLRKRKKGENERRKKNR